MQTNMVLRAAAACALPLLGSPDTAQLVNYLIKFVSPGGGKSAIAQSANTKGNSTAPGHQQPH